MQRKLLRTLLYLGFLAAAVLYLAPSPPAAAQTAAYRPIRLAYHTFDPLLDGEPAIAAALQSPPGSRYALLQFHGPVQAAWGQALRAAGVTFHDYVAEDTFLVPLPPGDTAAIVTHPAVRWLGPYHPAYRISPQATSGRLLLDLFPTANLSTVIVLAQTAGARIVQSRPGQRSYLLLV